MKTKPRQLLSTSGSNKYKYVLRHSPTPQRAIWGIHIHTHCWRWKHEASRGEARSRLCNMRIDGKYQSLTIYIGYNGLGFPLDSRRNIPRLWNQKGPSGQLIWCAQVTTSGTNRHEKCLFESAATAHSLWPAGTWRGHQVDFCRHVVVYVEHGRLHHSLNAKAHDIYRKEGVSELEY